MNIYEFIVQANQEFKLNGRSDRFVSMENRVLKGGKTLPIYFFARYTKGVDVNKFEKYMLNNASAEECYYFGMYVPGAKMMPFVQKAIAEGETILATNMVHFAKKTGEMVVDNSMINDYNAKGIDIENEIATKLDTTLADATEEYMANGRSNRFVQFEKKILYAQGGGNGMLFAKYVPGADVKAFQKSAVMRGDPLTSFEYARDVRGVSKSVLLASIQLSLLDYVEIEKDNERHKRLLLAAQEKYSAAQTDEERTQCSKTLEELTKAHTYKDKANGYIAILQRLMYEDKQKQSRRV